MPVYFTADTIPPLGSEIVFTRREEATGHMAELQRFELCGAMPHTTARGARSAVLTWRSHCMEEDCDATFSFTTGMDTSAFYRRCKPCRKGKRFTGWPKGPRIQHTLIESDGDAPLLEAPGQPVKPRERWPLYEAMKSADTWEAGLLIGELRREPGNSGLSREAMLDLAEARLARDDIDPASLF